MWDYGQQFKPENYSDYRNRFYKKTTDKIENILIGIKQCSLKQEHKEILKRKILSIINENLSK